MSEEERIAAFEPVRATVRPRQCDGRAGCWVTTGPKGAARNTSGAGCAACGGTIVLSGNEAAHGAMLRRVLVSLNQPAP